jgi:hypothetical protein
MPEQQHWLRVIIARHASCRGRRCIAIDDATSPPSRKYLLMRPVRPPVDLSRSESYARHAITVQAILTEPAAPTSPRSKRDGWLPTTRNGCSRCAQMNQRGGDLLRKHVCAQVWCTSSGRPDSARPGSRASELSRSPSCSITTMSSTAPIAAPQKRHVGSSGSCIVGTCEGRQRHTALGPESTDHDTSQSPGGPSAVTDAQHPCRPQSYALSARFHKKSNHTSPKCVSREQFCIHRVGRRAAGRLARGLGAPGSPRADRGGRKGQRHRARRDSG